MAIDTAKVQWDEPAAPAIDASKVEWDSPAPAAPKSSAVRRVLGDTGVDLARGVIGAGEAVVGLANIPTFGGAGKGLEAIGYRPQDTKDMIGELYSPERKAAQEKVEQAEGFVGTAKAMLQNPSTIAGTVVESVPSILGGGAVAQGLRAVRGLGTVARAAIGEGAIGAGSAAEGIRQQTDDGMLNAKQVGAAIGTGVGTGLIGAAGGAMARRLGIADVDVALAGGPTATGDATQNVVRRTLSGLARGAASEGVLEEMPQSAQEQAWQNVALDRPIGEDVAESAAMGLLTGAAMGGPVGAVSAARPRRTLPGGQPMPDPANGPLSRGVNVAADRGDLDVAATKQAAADADARAASGEIDPALLEQGNKGLAGADQRPLSTAIPARPWVDETTGVSREPTDDEIRQSIAQHLDAVYASGSRTNKKDVIAGLGLGAKRVNPILADIIAERQREATTAETPPDVQQPATGRAEPAGPDRSGAVDAGGRGGAAAGVPAGAAGAVAGQPADAGADRAGGAPDTGAASPAGQVAPPNLDPETGELLGIDAEAWPGAPAHQQPRAIIDALKVVAGRNKNQPDGITRIAETYGVDKDLARALRNRAISEMQAAAGSPRRADAGPPPANMEEMDARAHAWENEQFEKADDDAVVAQTRAFFGKAIDRVTPERAAQMTHRDPARIARLWDRITAAEPARAPRGDATGNAAYEDRDVTTDDSPLDETATYDETDELLDTDVGAPSGGPFTIRGAAEQAATKVTGGRVFPVEGGFVVRTPSRREGSTPEPNSNGLRQTSQSPPSAPASASTAEAIPETLPNQAEPPRPATQVPSEVPSVGTGSMPSAQGTPTKADTLVAVKDRYGKTYRVYQRDLDGERELLPLYDSKGQRLTGNNARIHRNNIDLTGAQRAEQQAREADNPLFDVVTNNHGGAFKTAAAAKAYGTKNGYSETHEVSEAGGGFVLRRRAPADELTVRANEAATSPLNDLPEPTQAQKDAGNYAKGHLRLNGHDISVENPAGSHRDPKWPALKDHYGYIRGTIGKDKDHVDVFMSVNAHDASLPVFVVDQVNKDGTFDEHKVIMGASDEADARATYLRNYSKGWTGLGAITPMTQDEFKAWVRDPKKTQRPAGPINSAEIDSKSVDEPAAETPNPGSIDPESGETIRYQGSDAARWDAMGAADREAVLKQDGGWGASKNAKAALNPTGRKIAGRAWADHPVTTRNTIARLMAQIPATAAEPAVQEGAPQGTAPSNPPPGQAQSAEDASETPPTGGVSASGTTEDAGQELWYNRRNRSGNGLQWSDVEGLNDTLKVKEVVKSKVWPRPDYGQLVADGLRPEFAHLVKQVYDTLATKPQVRGTPTDQQLQDYIETIGKVRDATFDFVRDNSRVGAALNNAIARAQAMTGQRVSILDTVKNDTSILDAVFPMADGSTSRWRTGGKTNENNARANLIGGNKPVGAMQITAQNFTDAIKAVGGGWPAPQEAWQRIYKISKYSSGFAVSRAGRSIERGLPTREAAESAAKAHYEQSRQSGTGAMAEEALAVEQAQRVGPAHRRPDEDITSERLMETFGFRGINFGNWMKGESKAKQAERQLHLNHAYDALLDLADISGLPPKAISLEGKLGLAFGAQGSGGRGTAHFVPGVNEINLTRRTGAGAIAHEWAHALDHYFAVQAGEAAARSIRPYMTQVGKSTREELGVRPEIAQAFQKIVNAMEKRPLTQAEVAERESRARNHVAEQLDQSLQALRNLVPKVDEAAQAGFDELAARLRSGDRGDGMVPTGRKVKGLRPRTKVDEEVSQVAGQMLGLLREHGAQPDYVLQHLLAADARAGIVAYQVEQAAQRKDHVPQTGEVTSNYMNEARALESKSAKKGNAEAYWSTPWEMFARGFQSYVIDRLASGKRRSDYLSRPQMSESSAKAFKEAGLLDGDMYPRGAERERINEGFDTLLGEIKTEDTAEGQVRLFSKAPVDAATDDTFFSGLVRAVETAKGAPKRAGATAWKQWMDGAQRRGELKQEERDWLGVDTWLDGQESVTREALADYVRANQVQVQDVMLGAPDESAALATIERAGYQVDEDFDDQPMLTRVGDDGIPVEVDPEDAPEHVRAAFAALTGGSEGGVTKFEPYTIPGGQNYRELLLTLPEVTAADRARQAELQARPIASLTESERAELSNIALGRGSRGARGLYTSSHFDQPNILAHVRFNERTDADGKRVLFLEEIQSDWHQAGRRQGYGGPKITGVAEETDTDFGPSYVVRWSNGVVQRGFPSMEAARAVAGRDYPDQDTVPDAPFKTTWPMLAFKRMVRYAADHGFERIAWTTGEQQAERYDLSKHVDRVYWAANESRADRAGPLSIFPLKGPSMPLPKGAYGESELADVVGKEVAERLVAAKPNQAGVRVLSGLDLKVGGDGMKGFYDRLLPTEVNKLAKRFGGKVGSTTISPQDPKQAAITWDGARTVEPGVQVHSLDITPDLRRAALGGQPLFSATRGAQGSAPLTFDRALQIKAEVTGQWGDAAPTVVLVEDAEGFPAFAKADPDYRRAEGLWGGRQTIWINVAAIATEKRLTEVLAHEAIGHYGVERILGAAQWTGIVSSIANHDRAGTGGDSLKRALRDVHRRYGPLDPETFAKEVIAVMAEQGARNGLMDRVVAAVRAWLRKMMPALEWRESDVRALLAQSEGFLRAGRPQAESRQVVAALAFSQAGITDADREAQKRGRRQLRGVTDRTTAAEINAAISAQESVKARLKDLKPVDKPSASEAPDFQAAQSIGEFWKALTAGEGIFEYGMPAKGVTDLQAIADAIVIGEGKYAFTQRGHVPGQGLQYGITTPRGRTGTLDLRADGTLQLHISGLEQGEGEGRALYMVVNTWAARNGYRALPDEGGLTPVNSYRRTQMMASSALRDGGTAHLMPAATQRLPHWREGDFGKPPTAAEQRFNTGYLFVKGAAQALNTVPLLDRVRFNFDTGRFEDTKGREFSNADFDALLSQLPAGKVGVGRRTAQRAVLTASAMQELAGQSLDRARVAGRRLLDDPAGAGSDLRGEDGPAAGLVAPGALRGALYSLADDSAPQLTTDARGQRSIRTGEASFREVGNRFYLTDAAGRVRDFRGVDAARAEADRTGGEVRIDAPIDGSPQTFSVVLPEAVARAAGTGRPLFSKAPADLLADIDAVMSDSHREGALARAKQFLKDATPKKIKDELRGTWLGALATRHLTELGADYFPNIRHYSDFLAAQQADRNKLASDAEAIAERARKWAAKNRAEARQVFDLMHQATIDGVDPAEGYQPLQFKYGGQTYEANRKNVKDVLRAMREQMLGRGGDNKKDLMAEAKRIREMPAREDRRKKKYPTLVERWNALSPAARALYTDFRDAYAERSDGVEQALVARINDTDAPENLKRKLINTIRVQFETQRLQGVYFPLQRFGRYFVAAEKGGSGTFLMFERLADLERAVKGLKEKGFSITAQGLKSAGKAKDAPSGTFVADVVEQLRKAGVSDQTQDQIYQLYLQTLPELSMRKHSIHRKVVPGFDPDAVRAFAFNMHHGAHQLARLRYGHKMQNVLDLLKKQQEAARREENADTRRIAAGDAILEELNKRDEWINNPQDSNLTNLVSSFGFVYYLGLTPAAALVNLTQTAMVSYPYLAARYGGVKAMNELLRAGAAAGKTIGNIQRTLTDPVEQRAHAVLQRMGAIDKTQAHNLAGIAEGGLTGYNPKWAKAMEIIGFAFHKTEVVNREATGMAAFRLARANGESFEQAIKVAADTIYDTHFDYSNANRARFMQSGTAKVLLMFRQYSLNMTWHLARTLWQATKGQDPQVRKIARRNLAGVIGMAGLFAGVLGLPLVKVGMGVLNAVAASAGDDDEPWDAETEFRAWLADLLGADVAELLLTGPTNALTGADVHSRVGLSDLWFRDADRELDGRGQYYHLLEAAAGPMGGVLKNALVGKGMIDEGHTWRGIETMLPKALKDMVKAARYGTEGVNNLRGDALLADPSLWQTLLQMQGFTPAEVSQKYETNRALKNYEQHILDRRQYLMNALAMSYRLNDVESRAETMEAIGNFNRSHPEIGITPASIRRSMQSRARYSARAEAGIVLNPKIAAKVRAQVGVDAPQ